MKRILIVDDDERIRKSLRPWFEEAGMEVVEAATKNEARQAFSVNPSFFAILMDGLLDRRSDTCDLIKELRQKFDGHVITMSSDPELRKRQMVAGCNHSVEKELAAEFVIQLAQA